MKPQDFANLQKKLDRILVENAKDNIADPKIESRKRIRTTSGSAVITPNYVLFNNSGYRQKFTWDEIRAMIKGKTVSDFYLDKTHPYYERTNLVFTDGIEQEHHLPTKEIPKV